MDVTGPYDHRALWAAAGRPGRRNAGTRTRRISPPAESATPQIDGGRVRVEAERPPRLRKASVMCGLLIPPPRCAWGPEQAPRLTSSDAGG